MKNSYLYLLWQNNKSLFSLLLIFVLGQAFFTYKQVETTPFFNYGMYSEPCIPTTSYASVFVYKNDVKIPLNQAAVSPTFLQYQLDYYAKLISQDSLDYTINTIENRFGKGTACSKYLIPYLSNSPKSIKKFPPKLERWLKNENLTISSIKKSIEESVSLKY